MRTLDFGTGGPSEHHPAGEVEAHTVLHGAGDQPRVQHDDSGAVEGLDLGQAHVDALHDALVGAAADPVADLDRTPGEQDQSGDEVVADRLQAEADADGQRTGDDGDVLQAEPGEGDHTGGDGADIADDGDSSRAVALRSLVAGLEALTAPDAPMNKIGSSDLAIALHEEDSRGIVLWAALRPFLKGYAETFPQTSDPPTAIEISSSIDVMLDEGVFFLTQQLIKRHLRGEKPLSLGGLAEFRYRRNSASWHSFQQTLAREVFDHARDLQLWDVEVLGRPDKGGGAIAGYKISAGRSLIDFNEFVFQPKRREQLRNFYDRFSAIITETEDA